MPGYKFVPEMVAELIDKTIQIRLEQLHRNISVINDHLHRIRGKPNPYVNEYGDYGYATGVLGNFIKNSNFISSKCKKYH